MTVFKQGSSSMSPIFLPLVMFPLVMLQQVSMKKSESYPLMKADNILHVIILAYNSDRGIIT